MENDIYIDGAFVFYILFIRFRGCVPSLPWVAHSIKHEYEKYIHSLKLKNWDQKWAMLPCS